MCCMKLCMDICINNKLLRRRKFAIKQIPFLGPFCESRGPPLPFVTGTVPIQNGVDYHGAYR